jgi:DNA-directed RNA polymerase subunit RPC12/RpoP
MPTVSKGDYKGYICPDCLNNFGINPIYLDGMEINMHLLCPYCGSDHGIKD